MKLPRLLVFLGGVAGVLAFFFPLLRMDQTIAGKPYGFDVSMFRIVRGVSSVREVVTGDYELTADEDERLVGEFNEKTEPAKKGYFLFLPGALLLALALLGRLGRGKASLALLAGLAGLFFWWALSEGFKKAATEATTQAVETGSAMTMLLAVAIAGCVGGLFGLVKPERRPDPVA
jgi:hypothetical protein